MTENKRFHFLGSDRHGVILGAYLCNLFESFAIFLCTCASVSGMVH